MEFKELWEKVEEHYLTLPDEAIPDGFGSHTEDRKMTLDVAAPIVRIALTTINEKQED